MNRMSQLPFSFTRSFVLLFCTVLAALALTPPARAQQAEQQVEQEQDNEAQLIRQRLQEPAGAVYTMTNATTGNEIAVFLRDTNGYLTFAGAWPTGGNGTGGGLGNQNGLLITRNHRWLLAVNAGSNSISVFEIKPFGLKFIETKSAGGTRPVSIAEHDSELVYVLNQGSDSISGFTLGDDGKLTALPTSSKPLSGTNTGAVQIAFDAHGELLLVTEAATNRITVFDVDADGYATFRKSINFAGRTPFGFAFGFREQLFVSEDTNPGALTSYELAEGAELHAISRSVSNGQSATCWVALSPDGRYAYVTNTNSDTISSYRVKFDGSLELLEAIAANTGDGPIDLTFSSDGRYLYVVNSAGGSLGAYRLNTNGRLIPIHGGADGLPTSINGIAAR